MLDKIVVPLDGSELAEQVLPFVQELGEKLEAEVVLLRAVTSDTQALAETAPGTAMGAELSIDVARGRVEAEREAAEAYLASVSQRLAAAGLKTTTAVVEGPPVAGIIEHAEQSGASLIALATHGRGGLARAVMGSVADAVVRNSKVPVLLIRASGG